MHLAFYPSRQVIEVTSIFSALRAHHRPSFSSGIAKLFLRKLLRKVTALFSGDVPALFASGSGMNSSSDWL
jgi:hypothetical protein